MAVRRCVGVGTRRANTIVSGRLVLAQYEAHYNGRRPHRSRQLRPPRPDHSVADLSKVRIKRQPVLGGLINEYERAA